MMKSSYTNRQRPITNEKRDRALIQIENAQRIMKRKKKHADNQRVIDDDIRVIVVWILIMIHLSFKMGKINLAA